MKDGDLFSEAWAVKKKKRPSVLCWTLTLLLVYVCMRSSVHVWLYLLCGEVAWIGVVGSIETRRGCETWPCWERKNPVESTSKYMWLVMLT